MHPQRSSGRPATPTSANSVLTFAESLRTFRTPSPTDDEAEQIWEAARNAPPLFPDLHLGQADAQQLSDKANNDAQSIYHLGPGERAVVKDTRDLAGNRQSVLLVYETSDEPAQSTPITENYDDCAVDISHLRPNQSRTNQPVHSPHATPAPAAAGKGKAKAKGKIYKLKKAFKLATSFKPTTERSDSRRAGNAGSNQEGHGLPAIRPVQVPASWNGAAPKVAEPVPRKTVGHPNRMTRWMDFSQYTAEEAHAAAETAEAPSSRPKRTPDLDKPLPDVPAPNSHLRLTVVPETMPGLRDSPPPLPADAASKIKAAQRKNRRTAVYAGSTFSSEDEVISTYDSSAFATPATTHTPPTSGDESDSGSARRLQLLDRLQKLSIDDDDDEHQSPVVDTFVHDHYTSFIVTERLDDRTIRSMYGTEERRDGDSPSETDPARILWSRLTSQVGSPGWSAD